MIEYVIDASVAIKWIRSQDEKLVEEARSLLGEFERGEAEISVPDLIYLEILNVAARKWHWQEELLLALAERLERLRWDVRKPRLSRVAFWSAQGLSAYDACYVALAEERHAQLVTADERLVQSAPTIALSLANFSPQAQG